MVPIVDLEASDAARRIDRACRDVGFFLLAGHGIPPSKRRRMDTVAREFFTQPESVKEMVAMPRSGLAWRGWFPLRGELTSGIPDLKEGYYVGRDLPFDHQAVIDGRPLHGPNLWPESLPELRAAVDDWMAEVETVGQQALATMAQGLGLDNHFFVDHLTSDPTVLFRIFRYPPHPAGSDGADRWGVGEHSDYGLLTLLAHDGRPGLEVKVADGTWAAVPADPELIVCNLGDMLDRLTAGRYRSTPHRVRNHAEGDRLSFPFFLDPDWEARIDPIALDEGWVPPDDRLSRWDRANLRDIGGTYGDWLTAKVRNVFPDLAATTLAETTSSTGRI